jgi:uncharacterized membrane protein
MTLFDTRAGLAVAAVLLLGATLAALFGLPIRAAVHDILNVVVGVVIAKFGTVYDYYFGSAKPPGG